MPVNKGVPREKSGQTRVGIEQVLLNLLHDAIDAIRDAGMKSDSFTVATLQIEDMVQTSVIDSGIDAEIADKVFKPLSSHKEYGCASAAA